MSTCVRRAALPLELHETFRGSVVEDFTLASLNDGVRRWVLDGDVVDE